MGDDIVVAFKDMADGLGERIESASTIMPSSFDRFTHECYMVEWKEGLYAELMNVEGLTTDEVIRAALVIGRDNNLLVQFLTVPNAVKARWIKALIQ